ncbi:MAG: putative Ig domain-containing protein [Chitinophagaceae bacterium]
MKIATLFFLLFGVLIVPAGLFSQIDYKGFPQWSLQKKDSTEYALYTPSNMQPGKKYPVVLFMHGCCGVDYHASLRNAVDPPVRMWHHFGENKQDVPTYIISPATSHGWRQHFKNLKSVIDDLIAHHSGDPQRIYVCGFSMGGEGTFSIIQEYPDYFAAAIPMGMSFRGDSLKVKDIPLWINQGETDWHSRFLRKQVAAIRALNGFTSDTGSVWVTGVNPRYSNFNGVGHGVQWAAASTQDLTGWAYSKINDGNKYPVVFFEPAVQTITAMENKPVSLTINASDPDGKIKNIDVYKNHVLIASLKKSPYRLAIVPVKGDNIVEAFAFDNKGKKSNAAIIVKVNIQPQLVTAVLPAAHAGDYYNTKIIAKGNGYTIFSLKESSHLPKGLQLYPDGTIKGITALKGMFKFSVVVTDEDHESTGADYNIHINQKKLLEVIVSNTITSEGKEYPLSKIRKGEAPFFNSKDSVLTTGLDEINFSELSGYSGYTFIQTDTDDANKSTPDFLSFDIDADATVYIAYEKLDKPVSSGIPDWLKTFEKQKDQIVAQYRYFDVFSKPYKKGHIVLPAADAKMNGVGSNYFVMIKKQSPGF